MSKTTQEKKLSKAKSAVAENKKVEDQVKLDQKAPEIETKVEGQESTPVTTETETVSENSKVRSAKVRGKKYLAAKKKIDVTKYYPLKQAVKLVRETHIAKFEGKIEAHITVFDVGTVGEITFPHYQAASKKIVIADDALIVALKAGTIDFDILIATPAVMPKLLPFARILGPKGLMPNPKNGTLTDKPQEAVKKLSAAKTVVKTEAKVPVVHIIVGKTSQPESELEANVAELINVIKAAKIKKLALCATMGPSVKVEVVR